MTKPVSAPRRSSIHAPAPAPEWEIGTGVAVALYFAIAFFFLAPVFLPGRQIYGTDYLAGSYFFFDFIASRFAAGELPAWVPYIYGGLPHFSSPGSTYYPVFALGSLVLPVDKAFALIFLVQFWVAGLGMYLLARELGCRSWVAFVAGIAFQLTGITTSWIYAGHDGRVIVATFSPLLFFFLHRGIRTGRVGSFAGAAATLGFALLSFQIQNTYYLLLAAALWSIFSLVHLGVARQPKRLARTVALGLAAVAFGFVLAAVNLVPFVEYVDDSPRGMEGGRGYEFSTSYSMPPGNLLGVAVPEATGITVYDPATQRPEFPPPDGGFKLHTEYLGALVVLLVALGFAYSRARPTWWFFLGLALFALSMSFGGYTPLYRVYYGLLPGLNRFRAPDLAYFVAAFSFITMAALTLEQLARRRAEMLTRRPARGEDGGGGWNALLAIVGAVVGVALVGAASAGGSVQPGVPSVGAGWGRFALFAALIGGVIWQWGRGRMDPRGALVALSLLTLVDLWVIGGRFVHTTQPPAVTFAADDVVDFLRAQPEPGRVWTFPFPQTYRAGGPNGGGYLMLFGIEQVGGEHPNQLQRWNQYLGAGTQTYVDWHNFLGPQEQLGVVDTPEGQAITFQPQPGFLEAANVRWIVSMAPLAHPSLRLVHPGPSALVYENTAALPRAYLVPEVRRVTDPQAPLPLMQSGNWDPRRTAVVESASELGLPSGPLEGDARVTKHTPDEVVVQARASRPALLVLADNYYDGWEATVDGRPAEILRTNHTLRGVIVPAGAHEVRFTFPAPQLHTGFWVTVVGFAALALLGLVLLARRRRSRRRDGEPAVA